MLSTPKANQGGKLPSTAGVSEAAACLFVSLTVVVWYDVTSYSDILVQYSTCTLPVPAQGVDFRTVNFPRGGSKSHPLVLLRLGYQPIKRVLLFINFDFSTFIYVYMANGQCACKRTPNLATLFSDGAKHR